MQPEKYDDTTHDIRRIGMIKNVAEKTGPKPETEKYRRQSRDKENSFTSGDTYTFSPKKENDLVPGSSASFPK